MGFPLLSLARALATAVVRPQDFFQKIEHKKAASGFETASNFKNGFPLLRKREHHKFNYFFPSILSLSACKASLASPKVGFASAAALAAFLAAAFTFLISSSLKIAV